MWDNNITKDSKFSFYFIFREKTRQLVNTVANVYV